MPPRTQSPFLAAPSQPPVVLPPPLSQSPFETNAAAQFNNPNVQLPPPTQFQIPPIQPPQLSGSSNNPFKRTGAAFHKTLQYQTTPPLSSPMLVNQASQPTSITQQPLPLPNNEELLQPENSEILSDAPHNDRNQYLQTGHLSEEPTFTSPDLSNQQTNTTDTNDYLPPPGLSRYVLGQPEISLPNTQLEPPPGLDRMVPGIELPNSTQLNLERQADGQDTVSASVPLRSSNIGTFNNSPTTPVSALSIPSHQEPLQNTDRNLYLVLGDESDSGQVASGQRVVDGRNTSDEPLAVSSQPSIGSSEQRELVMDGENLEDDAIRSRDEPLEGANLLDGPQPPALASESVHQDVGQIVAPKKFNDGSLAGSTGNDESDRERNNYFNRPSARRTEDPPRRREKPAAATEQRYDTEDTDYYSDRERERKRFGREGSARRTLENKDRFDRDRGAERNRGGEAARGGQQTSRSEKYRDDRGGNVSRRDGDRYEKDRYRYETDGSRYDPDDSRYNRQPRRRGDDDLDRKYRRDGRRRGMSNFILIHILSAIKKLNISFF